MAGTLNFERARFNMIEQQVRPWEVLDPRVLEVMAEVRREDFVPPQYRKLAFADLAIPLAHGELMMRPVVEGRLLQALAVNPGDEVLEIGTGSGYLSACLARLGRQVWSVERHADLAERARARIAAAGIRNCQVEVGDLSAGWQPGRRFDAIAVGAAVTEVPPAWLQWLKPGGRLFVVRGQPPVMEAVLMTRDAAEHTDVRSLFETDLPYLYGFEPHAEFRF
jgi:protein-L-isoaspartate(D-aspartate) O-methyltransferase